MSASVDGTDPNTQYVNDAAKLTVDTTCTDNTFCYLSFGDISPDKEYKIRFRVRAYY